MQHKRTIVVGDLHGCRKEAIALLERCQATPSDRVIFAGDLIDRGEDSAGCVDLAMQHECVLGNHEEKMLHYWRHDVDEKHMHPGHVETKRQLSHEHMQYLNTLPRYIRLPEHNAVVVHAGVFPGRSIEEQEDYHLLHIQMIKPQDGTKSKWPSKVKEPGWQFWTNLWDGPERIIFGHSVLTEPLLTDKVCGIDGGCVFGVELWAVILPDWQIVRQPAFRSHSGRPRSYPVHGHVGTY